VNKSDTPVLLKTLSIDSARFHMGEEKPLVLG